MNIVRHQKMTWVDFENILSNDISYLQENFDIHPLAIEEFATPTIRPRATRYPNCVFLTIHIPLFDKKDRATYPGELDIVITKNHLITGHSRKIYQLNEFFKVLQKSEGKRRFYMQNTPTHLLYEILKILLESCFPRLDHISQNIDNIELQVFNGKEKEMVREISIVKRDILGFRRALKPQRSILESIIQMKTVLIPISLNPYFQDLVGTNTRLWSTLESTKETIESLEKTNNSLLSNKLNTTMKVLTIFSAVMLPMSVYSGILAMSTGVPFGNHPYGFWIHIGIMLFISFFTIVIFKVRKWI